MNISVEEITEVALSLPTDVRALLADRLVESLNSIDDETAVREAWVKEIRRRVEEVKAGTAQLIDGDVAFARIDKLLAE